MEFMHQLATFTVEAIMVSLGCVVVFSCVLVCRVIWLLVVGGDHV